LGRLVCGLILVMTAVPGAPRRLLLSSSPRRGAGGPFATLALISVGLRLMGTLRVRTWQLWGAKTADCRCIIIMIIRTSPPRFQDSRLSYSRDSSGIPTHFVLHCFANPVPASPCQVRSTDSIADNSGQFHRKSADFSRNVANVHALATRRRDAFFGLQLKPPAPSWSGGGGHRRPPLAHRFYGAPDQLARASFVQKQSPACAAGLFIGAETTRYLAEATFPNWLSNGL